MKFSILAIAPLALTAPTQEPAPLTRRATGIPGKYIVKLKEGARATSGVGAMALLNKEPEHTYTTVFHGFAGSIDEDTLHALRQHPDVSLGRPHVECISNLHRLNTLSKTVSLEPLDS